MGFRFLNLFTCNRLEGGYSTSMKKKTRKEQINIKTKQRKNQTKKQTADCTCQQSTQLRKAGILAIRQTEFQFKFSFFTHGHIRSLKYMQTNVGSICVFIFSLSPLNDTLLENSQRFFAIRSLGCQRTL